MIQRLFCGPFRSDTATGRCCVCARTPTTSVGFTILSVQQRATHVLDLSAGYETIAQRYTRDRKLNLRQRAESYGWDVINSTDPEPLLTLFRDHHADGIDGGVGDWAYDNPAHD